MRALHLINGGLQFTTVGFCKAVLSIFWKGQYSHYVVHAEGANLIVSHLCHFFQVILGT